MTVKEAEFWCQYCKRLEYILWSEPVTEGSSVRRHRLCLPDCISSATAHNSELRCSNCGKITTRKDIP